MDAVKEQVTGLLAVGQGARHSNVGADQRRRLAEKAVLAGTALTHSSEQLLILQATL